MLFSINLFPLNYFSCPGIFYIYFKYIYFSCPGIFYIYFKYIYFIYLEEQKLIY